jgi:hypothetical protein
VIVQGYETLIVGVATDNLARYLNGISLEQLAQYVLDNFDMASLLPMEFDVSRFTIIKNTLAGQIKKMDTRIYEAIRVNLSRTHPQHSAFIGIDSAPAGSISPRRWYYQNMERVKQRIIDQLEGRDRTNDRERTGSIQHGGGNPPIGRTDGRGVLPGQEVTPCQFDDRTGADEDIFQM